MLRSNLLCVLGFSLAACQLACSQSSSETSNNSIVIENSASGEDYCSQESLDFFASYNRDHSDSYTAPIEDCVALGDFPTGYHNVRRNDERTYNDEAPAQIEAAFQGTDLYSLDGRGCQPVTPGLTATFCEQRYVCGCCLVELRIGPGPDGGQAWLIEGLNASCEERFRDSQYYILYNDPPVSLPPPDQTPPPQTCSSSTGCCNLCADSCHYCESLHDIDCFRDCYSACFECCDRCP